MEIYVKFLISIFSLLFLVFKHDFVCVDFTQIAALNTASA